MVLLKHPLNPSGIGFLEQQEVQTINKLPQKTVNMFNRQSPLWFFLSATRFWLSDRDLKTPAAVWIRSQPGDGKIEAVFCCGVFEASINVCFFRLWNYNLLLTKKKALIKHKIYNFYVVDLFSIIIKKQKKNFFASFFPWCNLMCLICFSWLFKDPLWLK